MDGAVVAILGLHDRKPNTKVSREQVRVTVGSTYLELFSSVRWICLEDTQALESNSASVIVRVVDVREASPSNTVEAVALDVVEEEGGWEGLCVAADFDKETTQDVPVT